MGGGSKQTTKSSSKTTQTAAPPTWTAPGLAEAASRVTSAMGQIPTNTYSGPMVASMTPAQLAAIQGAWGATAQNAGQLSSWMQGSLLPQVMDEMDFTTALPSTSYSLAPRQELDSVINASIHPVWKQLTEQVLPGMTSSALEAGAYSGDRAMSVLPTEAIGNATESAQRIASQLGYEDYQNYENRRLAAYQAETSAAQGNYALDTQRQTAAAADQLQRLGLAPSLVQDILRTQASQGDLLQTAAQLEMQNKQAQIDNQVKMAQWGAQAPFMGLDTASSLLAQLSGNWGTQTGTSKGTQTTTTKQDPMGQIMQAALGAGMMAMGMPGGASGIMGAFGGGSPATQGASSIFVNPTGTSNFFARNPFGGV